MKKSNPKKIQRNNNPSKAAKTGGTGAFQYGVVISLLLTLIAYLPAFKAGFVNWDDDDYVLNNTLIHHLSNVKGLMMTSVQGNYHPLTILSLALNYAISGLNPWSYHLFNVLLHLANVFLVYRLALLLSGGNNMVSFVTSLLFGVHPMHVESVAWVSERKDVLYGFFFLLALLSYLKYVDKGSRVAYISSLLWFLLSLASKPAAIIFPVALLTIDFYKKRKFSIALLVEKIPFVILSAMLAYLTLHAQKTVGATDTANMFSPVSRLFFGFYGYMMYFLKMIFPFNLCAFYPLPAINQSLPVIYYLSPLFFIASLVLCFATRKKYPVISFGFAFYVVNLLLVLQFFIIGSAVIAERYTYIPYIGLFFIIGWLIDKGFRQKPVNAYALIIPIGVIFTFTSYRQASAWISSATLWDNAIKNAPSSRAYINRATLLRNEGKPDKALAYYSEALKLNSVAEDAWHNRGNIYFDKMMDSLALEDYNHALSIKPDYVPALDSRAALFGREGKFDLALADLDKALGLQPAYKPSYKNRGFVHFGMQQYEKAIDDYKKYLSFEPGDADVLNDLGVCYQSIKKYELSIDPFTKAIGLSPKPVFYLNRSYSWNALEKQNEARNDALFARQAGLKLPPEYERMLSIQ